MNRARGSRYSLPLYFLLVRTLLFLSLPLEGVVGYGDLRHFWGWSKLEGWPFLDYWMEFPPLFPFLSEAVYRITAGREHGYIYFWVFFFSVVQAVNLGVLLGLVCRVHGEAAGTRRAWVYFVLLVGLFYGWGYFDPVAVLALLLSLKWLVEGRHGRAGISLGVGALTKWFPALALAAVWRDLSPRRAARVTALCLGVVALVLGALWLVSPEMTVASLRAQLSKGSWESMWALVDGNLRTGNFGPKSERYDPAKATLLRGNPPRIPSWLTLLPFAGLGLWLFRRPHAGGEKSLLAFVGLTFSLFLLWSPGWSPQWVLYLLPLVLLVLRERLAVLMAVVLVLVNLLEWPLLLSRGFFHLLWLPVLLRTGLLVLLAIEFWRER